MYYESGKKWTYIWPHLTCSFNKIRNCTNNTIVENRHKSGFMYMVSTNSTDLPLWKNTSQIFFYRPTGKVLQRKWLISKVKWRNKITVICPKISQMGKCDAGQKICSLCVRNVIQMLENKGEKHQHDLSLFNMYCNLA